MSDSIDRVFVKAISTIKALSARKGQGSLPQPPVESRIRLYGLYKQATEGDVEGIMTRPTGKTPEDSAGRRKWDAWKKEEGVTKTEAKRRYISFLIETMHEYASDTQESRELLSDLEYLWDQVKEIEPVTTESPEPLDNMSSGIAGTGILGYSGSNAGSYGSFDPRLMRDSRLNLSSVSGLQAAGGNSYDGQSALTSAAGGGGLRPRARGSSGSFEATADQQLGLSENTEMRKWQNDVTWALETINEEIMAIRHKYAAESGGGSDLYRSGSVAGSGSASRSLHRQLPHIHRQPSIYSYGGNPIGGSNSSTFQGKSARRAKRFSARTQDEEDEDDEGSSSDLEREYEHRPRRRSIVSALAQEIARKFKNYKTVQVVLGVLWSITKHVAIDAAVVYAVLVFARAVRGRERRHDKTVRLSSPESLGWAAVEQAETLWNHFSRMVLEGILGMRVVVM